MLRLICPTLCRRNDSTLLAMARRFAAGGAAKPPTSSAPTKPPAGGAGAGKSGGAGAGKSGGSCGPSAGPSKKPNPNFEKIKQLQTHFQKDDGKPIHLKGGSKDLMLYRITWALCLLGLVLNFHLYFGYILF